MGWVAQNDEQHVLIIVIPFGKNFGKGKISKTMTMQKDQKSTKGAQEFVLKFENSPCCTLLATILFVILKDTLGKDVK